jgi:hypothetical protein
VATSYFFLAIESGIFKEIFFSRKNGFLLGQLSSKVQERQMRKMFYLLVLFLIFVAFSGCGEGIETFNRTLYLEGRDSYVAIPNLENYRIQSAGFTLQCWLRVLELPPRASAIISNIGLYPGGGYQIQINREGIVQFEFRGTEQTRGLVQSGQALQLGRWYHITCIYAQDEQDSLVRIFIDGVFQGEELITGNRIHYQGVSPILYLGTNIDRKTTERNFCGEIDEVAIWNRPLTQKELSRSRKGLVPEPGKWLAGYWDFNSDLNGICLDRSGKENSGIIKGNARKVEGVIPK